MSARVVRLLRGAWATCYSLGMTNSELAVEIDRQVAEYDIDVNEAAVNVADELGRTWGEVVEGYYAGRYALSIARAGLS